MKQFLDLVQFYAATVLQSSILLQFRCQHMVIVTGFLPSSALGSKNTSSSGATNSVQNAAHYSLRTLAEPADSLKAPRPRLTSCLVQEIGQKTAHHRLVTDDQHVLLTLQLHDHRLQPLHQVLVRLSCKNKHTHTQKHNTISTAD